MKSKEQKRQEATVRAEAWRKLTPEQQLEYLDQRGFTAEKQRVKISKKIKKD